MGFSFKCHPRPKAITWTNKKIPDDDDHKKDIIIRYSIKLIALTANKKTKLNLNCTCCVFYTKR